MRQCSSLSLARSRSRSFSLDKCIQHIRMCICTGVCGCVNMSAFVCVCTWVCKYPNLREGPHGGLLIISHARTHASHARTHIYWCSMYACCDTITQTVCRVSCGLCSSASEAHTGVDPCVQVLDVIFRKVPGHPSQPAVSDTPFTSTLAAGPLQARSGSSTPHSAVARVDF